MLDARLPLPSRKLLFAAVLLTATGVSAQVPDTTKKATAQIMGAAAKQAAMKQAAAALAQKQAAVAQPAVPQWSAPKPCGGNPTYSHGKPGAPPTVPRLVGGTLSAARNALAQYGVFVDARFVRGTGRPDSIISHAPIAGTPVAPGDTVIVCSYFPTRIPYVRGQPTSTAQQTLKDSGYNFVVVTTPVPPTTAMGVVLQQSPRARSIAPLGSVDTLFVGVPSSPPPVPTWPMPHLDSATYVEANNALQALNASTNNQLLITWRSAAGGSYTTPGSIVVRQRPSADTPVKAGDTILVVMHDTTSPAQAPVVRMPDVRGPYVFAQDTFNRLRRRTGYALPVVANSIVGAPSLSLVVMSQQPSPGDVINAATTVSLVLRDTTPPRMQDLTGSLIAAMNTVNQLRTATGFPLAMKTNPMPGVPRQRLVVDSQQPLVGTILTRSTVVVLSLSDAAPPQFAMPPVVGGLVAAAMDSIVALRNVSGFGLAVSTTVANTPQPGDRLVVVTQSPVAGTRLSSDTSVRFVLRAVPPVSQEGTDTIPPATAVMPDLIRAPMIAAIAALDSIRRIVPIFVTRTELPSGTRPFDSTRAIVDSQFPAPNTILSAQSVARLTFRDTTTTRVTIMPNVIGLTVRAARDTLSLLGIPFTATTTDSAGSVSDAALIVSQSPRADSRVSASDTVLLVATNPATVPWLTVAAAVALLLAAAATTLYVKTGHQRLARMAVVPHVDPIPPRTKLRMRGGETADEAFDRIGLTITPVADRSVTVTRLTLAAPLHRDRHG